MKMNTVFRHLQSAAGMLKTLPVQDVKQNLKATLTQQVSKYGFVSREEFDTQTQILLRTRAKLEALELRLARFEQSTESSPKN